MTPSNRMVVPWGCSSAGRAPALQAGGQGFKSPQLHSFVSGPIGDSNSSIIDYELRFS